MIVPRSGCHAKRSDDRPSYGMQEVDLLMRSASVWIFHTLADFRLLGKN